MTTPSQISPYLFLNEMLTAEELAGSRLCHAGMAVIRYITETGGVMLTKSGAFNRKFVEWAVNQFEWPYYTAKELYTFNKVLNEGDVLPLSYLHALLRAAKLIRRVKGKTVPTRTCHAYMNDHGRLQALLFETFFIRFDFAAQERWPIEMPDADIFHFLSVVRNRLDDWVAYPEFAGWCLPIYALPAQRGTPEEDAMFYLATRVVRPLTWLGLLEEKKQERFMPIETVELRKTPLFDLFLRIEFVQSSSTTVH